MATYDCRKTPEPGSRRFPCPVVVRDAATGDRIPNVFYLSTAPPVVGRFVVDGGGRNVLGPDGNRLDVYERRAWVAVAVEDSARVVARSDCGEETVVRPADAR